MTSSADGIVPDTKNWTWVLERACPECGLDTREVEPEQVAGLLRHAASSWQSVLTGAVDVPGGVAARPDPATWSPLEYACHVRDVHRLFDQRVALMLDHDDPVFENWDQDATAVEHRYGEQDVATVRIELVEAAGAVAGRYAAVTGDWWQRTGRRSNGSEFTIETLGRYHLHDVVHHLYDVRS